MSRGAPTGSLPLLPRRSLQESRVVRAIRKQLVRRTLEMLAEIAGRDDGGKDYDAFWEVGGAQRLRLPAWCSERRWAVR